MNKKLILPVIAMGLLLVSCNGEISSNTPSVGNSSVSSAESSSDSIIESSSENSSIESSIGSSSASLSSSLVSSIDSSSEAPFYADYDQTATWPSEAIAEFLEQPEDSEVPAFVANKYYYTSGYDADDDAVFQIVIEDSSSTNTETYATLLSNAEFNLYQDSEDSKTYIDDYYYVLFAESDGVFIINLYSTGEVLCGYGCELYGDFPGAIAKEDTNLTFDLIEPTFANVDTYYYLVSEFFGLTDASIVCAGVTQEEFDSYYPLYEALGLTAEIDENYVSLTLGDFQISMVYEAETTVLYFDIYAPIVLEYTEIEGFDISIVNDYLETNSAFNVTSVIASTPVSYLTGYDNAGDKYVEFLFSDEEHASEEDYYKTLWTNEAAELINQGFGLELYEEYDTYVFLDENEELYIQLAYDETGVYYDIWNN